MPVNSHVQIPASIMRGFSCDRKGKETYVLELDNREPTTETIKRYSTVYGYFEDAAEELLSKEETAFGMVKNKIIETIRKGERFEFSDNELIITKRFITFTITRRKDMASMVQSKSVFCDILGIEIPPSQPIYTTKKLYPNGELLDKYKITYLVNKSKVPLVCPENCLYSVNNKTLHKYAPNTPIVVFPLTPITALLICEDTIGNIEVDSDLIIEQLNEDALRSVYTTHSDFIISAKDDELKRLQFINDKPDFQKKVFIEILLSKLKNCKAESMGDILSSLEMQMIELAYANNGLPDDIKEKFEKYKETQ